MTRRNLVARGGWYRFDNPPLYITIATGGETPIAGALLDNATRMPWNDFSQRYAQTIADGKSGRVKYE